MDLGIDVGFGELKAFVEVDSETFLTYRFPAAVKPRNVESLGISVIKEPDITKKYCILHNNTKYFIGNGIREIIGSYQTIGREKEKFDYYMLTAGLLGMIAAELGKNSIEAYATIGFPLQTREQFRKEVVNDLSSLDSIRIQNIINNEVKNIALKLHVFSVDQGIGAFFSLINLRYKDSKVYVNPDAVHYLQEPSLIIDIGTNTINALVVDANFEIDRRLSTSYKLAGTVEVIDAIMGLLKTKAGIDVDRRVVQEEILKKDPETYENFPVREIRRKAIEDAWDKTARPTIEKSIQEAESKHHIKNIVFCGGGAIVYREFIQKTFAQKYNVAVLKDPVMANAHGYYLWTKIEKAPEGE